MISVHGSGGNYATSVPGALLRGLAEFSVLGINTRQHDGAINTDNFFDVRKDIEAAVYAARSLGFRHIVLHGQSLGNIQVQYYAATNWDPGIKAVVLTGMFANLPWKSRHMLVRDERRYREMYDSALGLLRDNRETEPLPQKITSYAGVPDSVPVTSQHFLTYRSAAVATADGTYWIKRIPRPILMVRDEGDLVVRDFEPGMLIAAAKSEESLVPRIDFVLLPNANKADPLGHSFGNNQAQLVTIIADWLNKVGL